MLTYLIRRLLLMIPTLIGITVVVFAMMALSPGGVGGVMTSAAGEMQSENARAEMQYRNRRYGLDRPVAVQYLRWLNLVSPIGFRTSSQMTLSDAQLAELKASLKNAREIESSFKLQNAQVIAVALAQYLQIDPKEAVRRAIALAANPDSGWAMLDELHSQSDEITRKSVEKKIVAAPDRKAETMLEHVARVAAGADRVLFNRFTLKWPDLGVSVQRGRPINDVILEALPVTLLLNAISVPIVYAVAIIVGIYAARHRGKAFDVGSGMTVLALWSAPVMWIGVMSIGFLASAKYFQLFPAGGLNATLSSQWPFLPQWFSEGFERGWLLDRMWHLVLPVICMTYGGFAFLAKIMRSSMLENLSSDFIRTARAKGLTERVVLWQHAFRNSLLPLITVAAHLLPGLMVGSLIVERIFSIPGMGSLMIDAIFARDRDLVLAETLIIGLLGLISLLIADLGYAAADPRVSYE